MRFKARQLTQMANYEILIDMEHYKHERQQIEVSKPDKAKPERRYRVALEASDGWLIIAVHNFLRLPRERRRRQNDATNSGHAQVEPNFTNCQIE